MFASRSPAWLVLLSALGWVTLFGCVSSLEGWLFGMAWMIGFMGYTLNEDFIHRVLFHKVAPKISARTYYAFHGRHHRKPDESDRVVLPVMHQWILVAIMTTITHTLFIMPFGGSFSVTCAVASGCMLGYSFYEIAHLFAHDHPLVRWMNFLRIARSYHLYHHFRNANSTFGFCSPFWDWVFGTLPAEASLNPFSTSNSTLLQDIAKIKSPLLRGWRHFSVLMAQLPIPAPFYHWFWMHHTGVVVPPVRTEDDTVKDIDLPEEKKVL